MQLWHLWKERRKEELGGKSLRLQCSAEKSQAGQWGVWGKLPLDVFTLSSNGTAVVPLPYPVQWQSSSGYMWSGVSLGGCLSTMLSKTGFLEGRYEQHIILPPFPPHIHIPVERGLRPRDIGNVVGPGRLDRYKDSHALVWYGSSTELSSRAFAGLYFSTIRFLIFKVQFKYTTALMMTFTDLPWFPNLQFTFPASGILVYFAYRPVVFTYLSHQLDSCFLNRRIYALFDEIQTCLAQCGGR